MPNNVYSPMAGALPSASQVLGMNDMTPDEIEQRRKKIMQGANSQMNPILQRASGFLFPGQQ